MTDSKNSKKVSSADSLFEQHLRIIESTDPAELNIEDQKEFNEMSSLKLPKLNLSRPAETMKPKTFELPNFVGTLRSFFGGLLGPSFGAGATLAFCTLIGILIIPKSDILKVKGSSQIAVYWERDGVIKKLMPSSQLQDGDRIGARVLTSDESVAFWTMTDGEHNLLESLDEIRSSKLDLSPGLATDFPSSFTLVSPNQKENLIIVICKKTKENSLFNIAESRPALDRNFLQRIFSEGPLKKEDCFISGFNLRK